MADRQIGIRIMLEHQHFIQIVPISEADARALMDKLNGDPGEVVRGHSFNEEGQPWTFVFQVRRVVGMHTFAIEAKQHQQFVPHLPHQGQFPNFGRS